MNIRMNIRKYVIGLTVVCYLVVATFAQNKKLNFRDVLALKSPGSITVSADGKYVAYTIREVRWNESRFRTHIWLLNVESGEERQFTNGQTSESSPSFSPDGKYLAFTSSRRDTKAEADESSGRQIWLIPLSGGEANKLTSAQNGILSYTWSSDGKEIFFTTRQTLDKGVKARQSRLRNQRFDAFEVDKAPYKTEIWKIDIKTKKAECIFEGMYGFGSMKPSPDGKHFAFTTNLTGLSKDAHLRDIWIYDIDTDKARQLTSRLGSESGIIWSPDGKYILFSARKDTHISSSQTNLFIIPSKGGEPVNLTKDFDQSVNNVFYLPNGKGLVMTVGEGFYTHLYQMDIDTKTMTPLINKPINIGSVSLAKKAGKLVFGRQTSNTLSEIYISDLNGMNAKELTDFSSQLKDYQLARQEVISWKSKDKTPIEGLLVYPLDYTPGTKVPLIVNVHGGPHGHVRNNFSGTYQVYAIKGYAVLSPNFRGSSGYGADFDVANIKDLGFGDFQDIMTGVNKVIEMGVADPEKMGIMGGSYGGYMTNWAITQTDRFKAAVSMYGIFSMITDFSNSNIPRWELNYLAKFYWDDLDIYLKHSPSNYVKNIKTPVLILQGQADPNTVLSNSREIYTALKFLNKTVEFVTYPREGHGIRGEPNHIIDKSHRILEWFDRYLLEKPEAIPVGQASVEGKWELKVLCATSQPYDKDKKGKSNEVTVSLEVRYLGEKESDFSLNLEQDVYLRLKDDREVSPIGILGNLGGSENLVKTSSLTLSRAKVYPLKIVFKVPSGENEAKFKLKDFPFIYIQF